MQNLPGSNQQYSEPQYSEQPYINQPNQPSYPQDIFQSGPSANAGKTQLLGLDYNVGGLLCYVPFGFIAAIAFLMTEPRESRFVRFHAAQSLILAAALTIFFTAITIVSVIIAQIPFIGPIISILLILLSSLLSFASLGLVIFLIVKAYQNQMWKVPVLGNISENLANQLGGK